MTLSTASYLILLFPKPMEYLIVLIYLYLMFWALKKWYNREKVLIPMLLLALPMIGMKWLNVTTMDIGENHIARIILQIAGMSYLTFKVIGAYIDQRREEKMIPVFDFFNFSAFVPTLLIGPIDRFGRFQNDMNEGFSGINRSMNEKGWKNLMLGLLYKFIIAEAIRRLILSHLVNDGSVLYHLEYMYTYLFYLFFDFAGYTYLAMSMGNFMGIDVPFNFDKPFLALNPKEFWRKWHKTLGDWLNDYFFKPIFKYLTTKKWGTSIQRQSIALFMTFTLMGFWNGFEKHYILSGMLFGLYSVIHNYYFYLCKKNQRDVLFGSLSIKWVEYISIFIMFNAMAFAIYVFSGNLI